MKIAILTANEPLYLPAFFNRFLAKRAKDVVGVFLCEPVYKNTTKWTMFRRYLRTFGLWNVAQLSWRVAWALIRDRFGIGFEKQKFASIASAARFYNIPTYSPQDVNAPDFIEQLRHLKIDLILSVSCPQIFKEDLINVPEKGCLNLHGADLPEYRGIMPSFWMLAHGEQEAGVTLFYVNAGIDTGDVIGKRKFPILSTDSLNSFVIRAKQEACDLALDALDEIETGTVKTTPLEGKGSYFGWPTREAYREFRSRNRKIW